MTDPIEVLPHRLASKIVVGGGHWMWTGWTNESGYPYARDRGRDRPAYRVVYELLIGPVHPALELDHLCVIPRCCNPAHLEPVTHAENQRRIRERFTACRRAGHDWTDPRNVRVRPDGRRWCAECDRQDQRARRAAKKAAKL